MKPFIDTNVLLYVLPFADTPLPKRDAARAVLDRDDCVFSVQVLNEFMAQATRPTRTDPLSFDDATALVGTLKQFEIVPLDMRVFDLGTQIHRLASFSWWDSLIVAAAITAGCDTLLTEDMQHGRVIEGVRIENPFRELA